MSIHFNVTLLFESKNSALDRRQTCTTSRSFYSAKTSLQHHCSQGDFCEIKILPETEQCPKAKQINIKAATKTVRNSLPPTLLLTHGDQQEQNVCHQVEDPEKRKSGKKKISKEILYEASYKRDERGKQSVSI